MKLCNKDCMPACDFCIYAPQKENDYGFSWCEILQEKVSWADYCDDFHCFRVNEDKEINKTINYLISKGMTPEEYKREYNKEK